jgi:hypothetical protein
VATPLLEVTATITDLGAAFQYDYSIVNSGIDPLDEVAVVDIQVLPGDLTLNIVTLPPGFGGFYDAGLGLVSFFPELGLSGFLPGTTVSGFQLRSARSPALSTFSALTIDSVLLDGPTMAPIGDVRAVPEPATGVLLTLAIGALVRRAGRRKSRERVRPFHNT